MASTFNSLTNIANASLTNGSSTSSPNRVESMSLKSIRTAAYCVLILLSLIGNTFVIATVVRNTNKRMRTVSNIFIVNLSIADVLVTLVNMPAKISQIYIGRVWLLGKTAGFEVLCKMMNFVPFLAVLVSTQSFSVLAVDRFVAVYFPVRKPITAKVAYVLVGFVWVFSMGFFYVYFHSAVIMTFGNETFCFIDAEKLFGSLENFNKFVYVEFSLMTVSPMTISFILYVATMAKLWKRKIPGTNVTSNTSSYTERVNLKVLKMLMTVFIIFFLCWFMTWIWIVSCVKIQATASLPALCSSVSFENTRFFVAYSNSAITPFIYLIYSENYRQGFKDILIAITCCSSVKAVLRGSNRIGPRVSPFRGSFIQGRLRAEISRPPERLEFTTVL